MNSNLSLAEGAPGVPEETKISRSHIMEEFLGNEQTSPYETIYLPEAPSLEEEPSFSDIIEILNNYLTNHRLVLTLEKN